MLSRWVRPIQREILELFSKISKPWRWKIPCSLDAGVNSTRGECLNNRVPQDRVLLHPNRRIDARKCIRDALRDIDWPM
jgi:hypothetical protein